MRQNIVLFVAAVCLALFIFNAIFGSKDESNIGNIQPNIDEKSHVELVK